MTISVAPQAPRHAFTPAGFGIGGKRCAAPDVAPAQVVSKRMRCTPATPATLAAPPMPLQLLGPQPQPARCRRVHVGIKRRLGAHEPAAAERAAAAAAAAEEQRIKQQQQQQQQQQQPSPGALAIARKRTAEEMEEKAGALLEAALGQGLRARRRAKQQQQQTDEGHAELVRDAKRRRVLVRKVENDFVIYIDPLYLRLLVPQFPQLLCCMSRAEPVLAPLVGLPPKAEVRIGAEAFHALLANLGRHGFSSSSSSAIEELDDDDDDNGSNLAACAANAEVEFDEETAPEPTGWGTPVSFPQQALAPTTAHQQSFFSEHTPSGYPSGCGVGGAGWPQQMW